MRRATVYCLGAALVLAVLLVATSDVLAQTTAPAGGTKTLRQESEVGTAQTDYPTDWFAPIKKPVSWFEWGGDLRIREHWTRNDRSLDQDANANERHYQRYRSRLYAKVTPFNEAGGSRVDVNGRLVWEYYNFCKPDSPPDTISSRVYNEALFDNLNVSWSKVFGLPLTMIFGRQDIILGDGWLVGEGTPLDGSRTGYFDAVRGIVELKDIQTTIDGAFWYQEAQADKWITPFCDKDRLLSETNDRGAYVWLTNKSIERTTINAYLIFKDTTPNAASTNGYDANVYTFGGRVGYEFNQNWQAAGEIAQQLGDRDGNDIVATAARADLTYLFRDSWDNRLRMYYEWLSGDDPGTSKYEGFDIMYGRWARFSEIIANLYALEGGRPADYTNLHRLGAGWSCRPLGTKKVDRHGCNCPDWAPLELAADYQLLFAEQNPYAGTTGFSDGGAFRGQVGALWLKWRLNEHIGGHIMGELFCPGNYYAEPRDEMALFTRAEVFISW